MSNDPENNDADEEPPTGPVECHAWEVLALAAAHLRAMADFIERPNAIIVESYVRHKLERIEELLSIHEDLTRPVARYQANVPDDSDIPF